MKTSGSIEIIKQLDGRPVTDRRRFRQLMRKEIPKSGFEYEVSDGSYQVPGYSISYNETTEKVEVEEYDGTVTPRAKTVASEPNVGGTRKPRTTRKARKDGYPHEPDALDLQSALRIYLENPENGVDWHERLTSDRPTKLYFSVDLWAMSRVTRDPEIFINLLKGKLDHLKVNFEDPYDVEWFFRAPALFWVGPINERRG